MATIKVACPKCGQKVSGDEAFYGTKVECPVCSADIYFPGVRREAPHGKVPEMVPPEPSEESSPSSRREPLPDAYEAPPQAASARVTAPTEEAERKRPEEIEDAGDELPEVPSPVFGAISLVSSILVVATCFTGGILFAPVAIITGHMALAKARHSPVQPAPGQTLGALGLMIGYVGLFLTIILLAVAAFFGEQIRDFVQQGQV